MDERPEIPEALKKAAYDGLQPYVPEHIFDHALHRIFHWLKENGYSVPTEEKHGVPTR